MPTSRPASRTATRSNRASTSASCSTHTIAVPPAARSARSALTSSVPAGSSWAVGSSRTSSRGPIVTMLAMPTRCCSPPDSENGSRSARWAMSRRSRTSSIRASIAARGTARFSSPNASSSRTVSLDAESWFAGVENTMPARPSSAPGAVVARASTPSMATLPPVVARTTRGMNPAASNASVDLPAPVRPVIPTVAPASTDEVDAVDGHRAARRIADRNAGDDEDRRPDVHGRGHGRSPATAPMTIASAATSRPSRSQRSAGGSTTAR